MSLHIPDCRVQLPGDGRVVYDGSVQLRCADGPAHAWELRFRQVVARDAFWAERDDGVIVAIAQGAPALARVAQALLSRPHASIRLVGQDPCPFHALTRAAAG